MTTAIEARPDAARTKGLSRLAGPSLVLGGVAFFARGVTHPLLWIWAILVGVTEIRHTNPRGRALT